GGDVRVCAHHCARPTVEVPAHGDLLRGRFRVHVAEDNPGLGVRCQDLVGASERVVQVGQKDPALKVHDHHKLSVRLDLQAAAAGDAGREVVRTENVLEAPD